MNISPTLTFHDALQAEGYQIPKNCTSVTLVVAVDDAFELNFTTFVDREDLGKVGRAIVRMREAGLEGTQRTEAEKELDAVIREPKAKDREADDA